MSLSIVLVLTGCATMRAGSGKPRPGEAHLMVDCLLPPRLVSEPNLGMVALPRPPLKTTALDCAEQGGDYETGDPRWALAVWTPPAERGDPDAQYHVGEAYELGLGVDPDYPNAARWYRRAADQGHRAAAANLARLYERGLGVPQDWSAAVGWYQRAAGVTDPDAALAHTRAVLERMEERRRVLRRELERLERTPAPHERRGSDATPLRFALLTVAERLADVPVLAQAPAPDRTAERRIQDIVDELRSLQAQSPALRAKVEKLARGLAEKAAPEPGALDPAHARRVLGKYYGLVIGNANYLEWPSLDTPINDALALRDVLEERYGFEKPVQVIRDGKAQEILDKLDETRKMIDADAARGTPVNFVLFYAGHGAHRYPIHGHWIPVDGPREFSSRWIADSQVAEQLRAMKARQILVIADSCYASTLVTRGVLLEPQPSSIEDLLKQRPRMVLTSGGDHPVYERAGARHSLFTGALLDALRASHGVVRGDDLFRELAARVREAATRLGVEQRPEYLPILDSDHESGDVVLVAND